MKGWRPLAWAAEATKQKKLALRERGKAQVAQQRENSLSQHRLLSMTNTLPKRLSLTSSGIVPTPHLFLLRDLLVSPEPGEAVMQEAIIDQCPHHLPIVNPLPHATIMSSTVTLSTKRKGKGKSKPNDDLPPDTPPLSPNADTWAHFMHQWQLRLMQVTDDRAWNQVFPGALQRDLIDSSDVDPLLLHTRAIYSFLLVQRLMPPS